MSSSPISPVKRRVSQQSIIEWAGQVVTVGGDAPVRVQSMTNTDTADVIATAIQVKELARAGSEIVRITVDTPAAAAAPDAVRRSSPRARRRACRRRPWWQAGCCMRCCWRKRPIAGAAMPAKTATSASTTKASSNVNPDEHLRSFMACLHAFFTFTKNTRVFKIIKQDLREARNGPELRSAIPMCTAHLPVRLDTQRNDDRTGLDGHPRGFGNAQLQHPAATGPTGRCPASLATSATRASPLAWST